MNFTLVFINKYSVTVGSFQTHFVPKIGEIVVLTDFNKYKIIDIQYDLSFVGVKNCIDVKVFVESLGR